MWQLPSCVLKHNRNNTINSLKSITMIVGRRKAWREERKAKTNERKINGEKQERHGKVTNPKKARHWNAGSTRNGGQASWINPNEQWNWAGKAGWKQNSKERKRKPNTVDRRFQQWPIELATRYNRTTGQRAQSKSIERETNINRANPSFIIILTRKQTKQSFQEVPNYKWWCENGTSEVRWWWVSRLLSN